MKFRLYGVFAALLITWSIGVNPVWSQDTAQPANQKAAQPMNQETAQPADQEVTQSPAQEPAQPSDQEAQNQTMSGSQETAPSAVTLAEAVVCQDVVDRAPVGSGEVFAKEVPKLYCFTRVVGAEPGSQLTHNWYYNGTLKASVKLNVGSSNFRTWSSKSMMPEWTGEWMVEILSPEGTPMDSIIFMLK